MRVESAYRPRFWPGILLIAAAGCGPSARPVTSSETATTLTIGVAAPTGKNPLVGLQQVASIISFEQLVNFGRDGQPRTGVSSGLASGWSRSADQMSFALRLRPNVKFPDGSPLDSKTVSEIVGAKLLENLGPASEDIQSVKPISDSEIQIVLRRPSAFLPEGFIDLEIGKQNPDGRVGTGAFYSVSNAPDGIEMAANKAYYLGRPNIDRIVIKSYGTLRAAWADMLRGHLDMLYEVGIDAIDSLKPASNVRLFTFPRSYAYVVVLNTRNAAVRDPRVRAALNAAVDRAQIITQALNGHGTPATGGVFPFNWAYDETAPAFHFDPTSAASAIRAAGHGRPIKFKCATMDISPFERIAVTLQRQLNAVGVEMEIEGLAPGVFAKKVMDHDFDAALLDARLGPNMARTYQWWHSGSPQNYTAFSSTAVDRELDAVRHSKTDAEYRTAVAAFQRVINEDPPAIFLAWSDKTRAISTRFDVPIEPGRDVLSTLRLWKPVAEVRAAARN